MKNPEERGVTMLALVIVLMPLVLTVGAFTATMTSRTDRLSQEIDEERALLAAESGVDYAIWVGKTGAMVDGYEQNYSLGQDARFYVRSTHLLVDDADNDKDTKVDEADEDVFQIIVTGRYRNTTRRIAAYLGPVPLVPNSYPGAMTTLNPSPSINLSGSTVLSGFNTNMDGTLAGAGDVAGLSIGAPGTLADLSAELTGGEANRVQGPGGPPSLGTGPAMDLDPIVAAVQNAANIVLTNSSYGSYYFGSGPGGDVNITYRDGNVRFSGNSTGAGILLVTGNLQLAGTFRFDGVIIVLGDIICTGTAQVYGAVVQGPTGSMIRDTGTFDVRYSQEAITLANSIGGRYVSFNGWQELAR